MKIDDGIIDLDTDRGKVFDFTSDKFELVSYLWRMDNSIVISFVASKKKGNFRGLVENILKQGLSVKVPTPLPDMKRIVIKCGYTRTFEDDPGMGPVEVWVLEPRCDHKNLTG
jgi:hypothetical protein